MMPLFLGTSKSGRGSPRLSPTTNVLLAAQALYRSALGGMHHTESPTTWSAARAGCGGAARRKVDRRSAARRAVPIVVAVVDGTTEMRIRAKEEMVSPTALPQRAFGPGNRRDQKLPPVRLEQRLLNKHDLSSASSATPSNSNHILSAALVEIFFFCEFCYIRDRALRPRRSTTPVPRIWRSRRARETEVLEGSCRDPRRRKAAYETVI
jgi:hypothetical protein